MTEGIGLDYLKSKLTGRRIDDVEFRGPVEIPAGTDPADVVTIFIKLLDPLGEETWLTLAPTVEVIGKPTALGRIEVTPRLHIKVVHEEKETP